MLGFYFFAAPSLSHHALAHLNVILPAFLSASHDVIAMQHRAVENLHGQRSCTSF